MTINPEESNTGPLFRQNSELHVEKTRSIVGELESVLPICAVWLVALLGVELPSNSSIPAAFIENGLEITTTIDSV